jgi:NADPH:quinone reductase-like Zn-dependent oxidoreductase
VRVRVHAAGLHIGDAFGVRGSPFPVRFTSGLRGPKLGVPGYDIAGTVEATGRAVTRFAPGDEVFGTCTWPSSGACAEYARADEETLASKPSGMTFEQAAALPTSASAALHGLRDAGRLRAGQRVLINGASGGVGTYAVQIARALGAEVTGVCGPTNVELVRSLGAHHVIDYTREDFTRGDARYDLILDNIENHSLADCRRALAPEGTLVLMSGTGAGGLRLLVRLIRPVILSPFVKHSLRRPLSNPNREDLEVLVAMVEEGTLRPVIDVTYPMTETAAALRHIEAGHARGKVVIVIPAA